MEGECIHNLTLKNQQISPPNSNMEEFSNSLPAATIAVFHIITSYDAGYKFS